MSFAKDRVSMSVRLAVPAGEMAQEEIAKQLAFLHPAIAQISFTPDGGAVLFSATHEYKDRLAAEAREIAANTVSSLRSLTRRIAFASKINARFPKTSVSDIKGVQASGLGQVVLEGLPAQLYRYFDRKFTEFGRRWPSQVLITPSLIPAEVLTRCGYLESFPHNITFACHLAEDAVNIFSFREKHRSGNAVADATSGHLHQPTTCLSPAVCYHVYHINQNRAIPSSGIVYEVCGRCFRYEGRTLSGLRRLWDFTMRETVFLGGGESVIADRDKSIEWMGQLLEEHELAGEIRTASDPFFIAPDAGAKTYFQLSSETKYEISLFTSETERLAVGSHNIHRDFFGRAFNIRVDNAGFAHSACVAFGLERWVCAFLAQHGQQVENWPAAIRSAIEFH